jgi:hypothetical protein
MHLPAPFITVLHESGQGRGQNLAEALKREAVVLLFLQNLPASFITVLHEGGQRRGQNLAEALKREAGILRVLLLLFFFRDDLVNLQCYLTQGLLPLILIIPTQRK